VIFINKLGQMYDVLGRVFLNSSFIINSMQEVFYILNFKSSKFAIWHAKSKNNYLV